MKTMKIEGFSRTMMKAKGSLKLFHDEDDEGQGQVTSPDEDQGLRVMKTEDSARTMMKARSSWRLCEEDDDELWELEDDEGWRLLDDDEPRGSFNDHGSWKL